MGPTGEGVQGDVDRAGVTTVNGIDAPSIVTALVAPRPDPVKVAEGLNGLIVNGLTR